MIFVRASAKGEEKVELCIKEDGKELQVLSLSPEHAYRTGLDLLDNAHDLFIKRETWDR